MRIDRFLHCIRLATSRTLAQSLVEAGHVRIDGKRALKPSEPVRVGSVVAFPLRGEVRILRILALPLRRGPASEARACYEALGVQTKRERLTSAPHRHSAGKAPPEPEPQ